MSPVLKGFITSVCGGSISSELMIVRRRRQLARTAQQSRSPRYWQMHIKISFAIERSVSSALMPCAGTNTCLVTAGVVSVSVASDITSTGDKEGSAKEAQSQLSKTNVMSTFFSVLTSANYSKHAVRYVVTNSNWHTHYATITRIMTNACWFQFGRYRSRQYTCPNFTSPSATMDVKEKKGGNC